MDIIFEIFITNIIVHFFGRNTRYYFFKLIGRPKTMKYLKGEFKKKDEYNSFSQGLLNGIVGLISFGAFSILFVYLSYTISDTFL